MFYSTSRKSKKQFCHSRRVTQCTYDDKIIHRTYLLIKMIKIDLLITCYTQYSTRLDRYSIVYINNTRNNNNDNNNDNVFFLFFKQS